MNATDDMIRVGDPLPKIASVQAAPDPFSILVQWAEGSRAGQTNVVNLAPMIHTFKVFRPLRDDSDLFEIVRVGEDGASVVWGDNPDLEIGADAIEEMAEEVMTNHDFSQFMQCMGWSYDATAAQLGISRRLVAYYAKDREVPRHVMLACRYLSLPLKLADVQTQAEFSCVSAREFQDLHAPKLGQLARAFEREAASMTHAALQRLIREQQGISSVTGAKRSKHEA